MAKTRPKKSAKSSSKTSKFGLLGVIKLLLIFGILAVGGYGAYRYQQNPPSLYPYPYTVNAVSDAGQDALAQSAQVLFVGDRMSVEMQKYTDALISRASNNITEPINFHMWAAPGTGLHRTLAYLRTLAKLPPVIIYFGGSEEFHETRVHPLHYKKFLTNKMLVEHEVVSSLILAWPEISRIIYEPYERYRFNLSDEIKNGPVIGAGPGKVEQMEMLFKIYEWEFEELIQLTKQRNVKLIVVTPPINLLAAPAASCSYSDDPTIQRDLMAQQKLLDEGKSKEAYDTLKVISEQTIANANALYLLGRAGVELNRLQEARAALTKAAAVDCGTWRPNPIINEIMRKSSNRNGIALVDYDQQLNAMLGQNVLFFDSINPQNIYNRAMMEKLGELVARLLDL